MRYSYGQPSKNDNQEPDGLTGTPAHAAIKRVVEVLLDARRETQEAQEAAQQARAELEDVLKAVTDYRDAVDAAQHAFNAQLEASIARVRGN